MTPAIAERDAAQRQARRPDRPETGAAARTGCAAPQSRRPRPWRRDDRKGRRAAANRRVRNIPGCRATSASERAQQLGATFKSDKRVIVGDLKALAQCRVSVARLRVGAHWRRPASGSLGSRRKIAARKHGETGQREPFGAAEAASRRRITIAPRGPAPASSRTLTMARSNAARARAAAIAPIRRLVDGGPAVFAIEDKMPPARVERHVERRITLPHRLEHEIDGVDRGGARSTRKCGSLSSSPSASMRCARSRTACGAQKRKRGGRIGIHDRPACMSQNLSSGAADRIGQVLRLRRLRRVIAGGLLGRDFHMGVGGNQLVWNRHAFDDLDALADQRIIFHVAHRDEPVDAPQTEPMDRVRHQLLEARVLNAGDAFGALEIGGGGVAALLPLARVVDQELGDFAERAALLAVIDDDADAAGLRRRGRIPRCRGSDKAGRCRCRSRTRRSRCTRRARGR